MIFSGWNAGFVLTVAASLLPSIFAQTVTYQAEDATLTGVTVATASAGYSGTLWVVLCAFENRADCVISSSQVLGMSGTLKRALIKSPSPSQVIRQSSMTLVLSTWAHMVQSIHVSPSTAVQAVMLVSRRQQHGPLLVPARCC